MLSVWRTRMRLKERSNYAHRTADAFFAAFLRPPGAIRTALFSFYFLYRAPSPLLRLTDKEARARRPSQLYAWRSTTKLNIGVLTLSMISYDAYQHRSSEHFLAARNDDLSLLQVVLFTHAHKSSEFLTLQLERIVLCKDSS